MSHIIEESYFYCFNFYPRLSEEYEPNNWIIAVNNKNFRKSIFHALDRKSAMLTEEPYEPENRLLNTITPKNFISTEKMDYTQLDALWMKRYMKDELNKDYVKLAMVKGLRKREVMKKHVFLNAFVPMIQYLPASILFTISGSIYIEFLWSSAIRAFKKNRASMLFMYILIEFIVFIII